MIKPLFTSNKFSCQGYSIQWFNRSGARIVVLNYSTSLQNGLTAALTLIIYIFVGGFHLQSGMARGPTNTGDN